MLDMVVDAGCFSTGLAPGAGLAVGRLSPFWPLHGGRAQFSPSDCNVPSVTQPMHVNEFCMLCFMYDTYYAFHV